MYFIAGFLGGLYLYCLGIWARDKIQWRLAEKRWRKSGAGQVHFQWSDLSFDEVNQHCNQIINDARGGKIHGKRA